MSLVHQLDLLSFGPILGEPHDEANRQQYLKLLGTARC